MSLFDTAIESQCRAYSNLRDAPECRTLKDYAEHLWAKFAPFADPGFRDLIARDFSQRYWEMYLGNGLLNSRLALQNKPPQGPDFQVKLGDRVLWVEAIAPTSGNGPDAVHDLPQGVAHKVQDEALVLRLRGAIDTKFRVQQSYLKSGVVRPNDIYVISVNARSIPQMFFETDLPRIARALYPIGPMEVVIDKRSGEVVDTRYALRESISKKSGALVDTTVFADERHSSISAVIYCNSDAGNHPNDPGDIGRDFSIFYNPYATVPLDRGVIRCGQEFVVDDGDLVCHRHGASAA